MCFFYSTEFLSLYEVSRSLLGHILYLLIDRDSDRVFKNLRISPLEISKEFPGRVGEMKPNKIGFYLMSNFFAWQLSPLKNAVDFLFPIFLKFLYISCLIYQVYCAGFAFFNINSIWPMWEKRGRKSLTLKMSNLIFLLLNVWIRRIYISCDDMIDDATSQLN